MYDPLRQGKGKWGPQKRSSGSVLGDQWGVRNIYEPNVDKRHCSKKDRSEHDNKPQLLIPHMEVCFDAYLGRCMKMLVIYDSRVERKKEKR